MAWKVEEAPPPVTSPTLGLAVEKAECSFVAPVHGFSSCRVSGPFWKLIPTVWATVHPFQQACSSGPYTSLWQFPSTCVWKGFCSDVRGAVAGSYELTDTEKEPDTQKCIHSELLRLLLVKFRLGMLWGTGMNTWGMRWWPCAARPWWAGWIGLERGIVRETRTDSLTNQPDVEVEQLPL